MVKRIVAACLAFAAPLLLAAALPPWSDPAVNSIGRLPARVLVTPCESAETALAVEAGERPRTDSAYVESLDGTWDFKWKPAVAAAWEKEAKIAVPGCWQLQGAYDPPVYVSHGFAIPFDGTGNPMLPAPEDWTCSRYPGPVGLYSRTFAVPVAWKGRRVVVRFGGVSSAFYLRVNGRDAGYSEDSRSPAEFDITPFLADGENRIEVEVFKFCDGIFLEDQDMWRLSGIFRSVWLVAEAPGAPRDLVVETELSEDFSSGAVKVRDEKGATLYEERFDRPKLWDAGAPNLYMRAFRAGGDYFAVAFGFRRVEIRGAVLLVNGRRAVFRGVNRHEMNPETGYTVTRADMERDLAVMKDLNVNAVRCCHYPDDPEWYALCDRAGVYVVAEANVESHGAGFGEKALAKSPLFHDAIVERNVNMVKALRNHPSIVVWSLGNESGDGPNFADAYAAVKALDATRPVQYEGAQDTDHSDVKCPMYPTPAQGEAYAGNRPRKPYVMCEYAHAMGNSCGDFARYWEVVARHPSAQGGFVWDLADQALWQDGPGGCRLAYGGDFGDVPNKRNFNCNGLVDALRRYHPSAYEVKAVYGGRTKPDPAPPMPRVDVDAAGEREVSEHPFRLNFWRAPTDNDRGWNMEKVCAVWKDATRRQAAPKGAASELRVWRRPDGAYRVRWDFSVTASSLPPIPRVGLTFKVPKACTRVRWTGRGPHENYCDRAVSAPFGTYEATVDSLSPWNYVIPGEQGYRTECRDVSFASEDGRCVFVTALNAPIGFNAWPYTQEKLERSRHMEELVRDDFLTVNVDAAQMGVGGVNSWGARPLADRLLGTGEYRLEFLVSGLE